MNVPSAEPGPGSAQVLLLARGVVYATISGSNATAGYYAARAELEQLSVTQLLDVAATLALLLGRSEIVLTTDEWAEVVDRIARGSS